MWQGGFVSWVATCSPRSCVMPPAKNLTSVRMMLSGFIGLAVVYAGTAVYTFQLRAVDETPEIKAAKAKILAERDERRKVRSLLCASPPLSAALSQYLMQCLLALCYCSRNNNSATLRTRPRESRSAKSGECASTGQ